MPVCKDCGKQFGDGAFIYHECKSELRIAIDNCLVNPAELRKEIVELKRQLEERTEQLRKEYMSAIDWAGKHQEAIENLAESQAREARLREALEYYRVNGHHEQSYNLACSALALPHDDTALKEYRNSVIDSVKKKLLQLGALEDGDYIDALYKMKGQ